jgi:hypothetical protein
MWCYFFFLPFVRFALQSQKIIYFFVFNKDLKTKMENVSLSVKENEKSKIKREIFFNLKRKNQFFFY